MSSSSDAVYQFVGMAIGCLVVSVVADLGGCSVSQERFDRTMRNSGFENARQGAYDFFECGYSDVWASSFKATRVVVSEPKPRKVSGTVCCGIVKGCTVRWE